VQSLLLQYPTPSQTGVSMMSEDASIARSRALIRAVYNVLGQFRELSPTMPVAEVQMFLMVALHEGSSLGDLSELMDMRKSTASRYLLDLSDKTRAGGEGYGLIVRENDPHELRRNMYSLSAKGRHLVNNLAAAAAGAASRGDLS
jgi:DNA-binding MarR family transcriptional regulator